MGYIIASDYNRIVQDVTLQQIISGNTALKSTAELSAISEMKSYLSAKYDVDREFTNSQVYNPQVSYSAGDRVYLNAAAYSPSSTYTPGQLALQAGIVYQCTTSVTVSEVFDASKWASLGAQYDIYYANYPYPVFNMSKFYDKGGMVFWNNHTYTCKIATSNIDHQTLIQYQTTNGVPNVNVFPDDLKSGAIYWTDTGLYLVPPGNLLATGSSQTTTQLTTREDEFIKAGVTTGLTVGGTTYAAPLLGQTGSLFGWTYTLERVATGTMEEGVDYVKGENGFQLLQAGDSFQLNERFVFHFLPIANIPVPVPTTGLSASQIIGAYFTKGDNRNQQLVTYCLDIIIYTLYRRIPPSIVPEIRIMAYQTAISWLRNVSKGEDVVADIIKLQPKQGGRIRYGSNIKLQNNY